MKHSIQLLTLLLLGVTLAIASSTLAQDPPGRAALVVRLGDEQTVTRCVEFDEPEISGLDLLERSGLALAIEYQSGGAAVCSIESTGCPADDCFCQCKGGADCVYWSYWQLSNGTWNYSLAGAGAMRVEDGQVHGWTWGPGSVTEAIPPDPTSFEAICTSSEPSTNTPVPTSPSVILPTQPAAAGVGATSTATPRPTATQTAVPAVAEATASLPTATAAIATVVPATVTQAVPTQAASVPAAGNSPDATATTTTVDPTQTIVLAATTVDPVPPSRQAEEVESTVDSAESDSPTNEPPTAAIPPDGVAVQADVTGAESGSIENDQVGATQAAPVAVVGALVTAPDASPATIDRVDSRPGEELPASHYALFGAMAASLAALFGVVYLRRGSTRERGQ